MRGESERLLYIARPSFEIDGKEEDRLSQDLLRMRASEDEEGIARLEVVFINWGRKSEGSSPDFVYFDGEILDLGKEIRVDVGAEDRRDTVFRGLITAIEACYPELRPPEIVVCAEDRLQFLRMRRRTRFFESSTDQEMSQTVAGDAGLGSDSSTAGPTHEELWQVNQSDLGFLRERARAVDARVGMQDGQLFFRTRRESGRAPIQLSREADLLRFQVSADLAHQRAEVRVHGYNVANKEAIHETAGEAAVASESGGGGRTGPSLLARIDDDAIEDLHLEVPATSEEARALAESIMKRRARRFVCGRGVTSGTPAMRVGEKIDIVDAGDWFSGIYHLAQVCHTYDQCDGYRTHFRAERVDLGGP